MRPNVFIYSLYCPEDFFSHSLAYVTNLFPEVGQQLVETIATLATNDKKSDHFGAFERCEFVGYEFQANHMVSRPDLTIRAYPVKYRQYPLLNPRFSPTASWLDKAWDTECLDVAVISQGRHETLDQELRRFDATTDCVFLPDDFTTKQGLRYHGYFILPLRFTGVGATSDIDFTALKRPLSRILQFCTALEEPR